VDTGFSYHASFTVVGIVNTVMDKIWYVYIPKSAGVPTSPFPVGLRLGRRSSGMRRQLNFTRGLDLPWVIGSS